MLEFIFSAAFLELIIKILVVFSVVMLGVTYYTLSERKVSAFLQDRLGPNRVGKFGWLQPFADGIKLFFKEDLVPANVDKILYFLAPCFVMIPALMIFITIPFGDQITLFGRQIKLQILDTNIGILFIFAFTSFSVYGILMGGWSSNNKYSLLGGLRSTAQMISYEVSMGLSLIGVFMIAGSLQLSEIVHYQSGLAWFVILQPLGFIIFLVSAFVETNRLPFDLPECEAELVGGFHTEYGSMKFALYFMAEYTNMITMSALITTLFFGGWQVPGLKYLALPAIWQSLVQIAAFAVKTLFFMFLFMWVRWTIPRFRYDQLMRLGWKILLPLSFLNIFVTGLILSMF